MLIRAMEETWEVGENDMRRSELGKDKVNAIFGHGPAGFTPRPEEAMPAGCPERKAARDVADFAGRDQGSAREMVAATAKRRQSSFGGRRMGSGGWA
jgi:hypothetical protein